MKANRTIWAVFFLLFQAVIIGCGQKGKALKHLPVPDAAVAQSAVSRIDSLLGYGFSWKFSRKQSGMMPKMRADLEGKVSVPNRIYIRGTWTTGTVAEKLDAYSIEGREYQYDKSLDAWERRSSGSFLDPHEHLKLVLSFGEFSFQRYDSYAGEDCFVFSFKPNVYFLDPVESSEPEGLVWVGADQRIPLRIAVTSKSGILSWEMKLTDINTFADLTVPFEDISFTVPDIENSEDVEVVVNRFLYLGFEEPHVEREGNVVRFSVKAEYLADTLIAEMLKRGDVEIYHCMWPTHPIYKLREDTNLVHEHYGVGSRLLFERGVITKPIIAAGKALSRGAFQDFELKNDLLGDFSIYGVLSPQAMDSLTALVSSRKEEPVIAVIDGSPMLITTIRDAWLVEQRIPLAKGLEGREAVRIYSRLKQRPLGRDYTFTRIAKEE